MTCHRNSVFGSSSGLTLVFAARSRRHVGSLVGGDSTLATYFVMEFKMLCFARRTRHFLIILASLLSLQLISSMKIAIAAEVLAEETAPVTLRVALYPYVPDRHALFYELESGFEKQNPGVNLELIDTPEFTEKYYKGGLEHADADVYEFDTILLSDLVAAKKSLQSRWEARHTSLRRSMP